MYRNSALSQSTPASSGLSIIYFRLRWQLWLFTYGPWMFYLNILLSYIHKTLLDVSRELRPLLCCFGRIVTLWIIILSIHWENGLKNKQSPNSWLLNWIFTEIGRFQSANVLKTDLERCNIQIGLPWVQDHHDSHKFCVFIRIFTYITALPFYPLFSDPNSNVFKISDYKLATSHLRVYPHRASSVSGRLDPIGMHYDAWKSVPDPFPSVIIDLH